MNITKAVVNTSLLVAAGVGGHFFPMETIAVILMLATIVVAEGWSN